MKGKVNWFHVLQIFLAGLVGAIIFVLIVLPTNVDGAMSYKSSKNKMMKKRDNLLHYFDISEEEFDDWYYGVRDNPPMFYLNNIKFRKENKKMFVYEYEIEEIARESSLSSEELNKMVLWNRDIMDMEAYEDYAVSRSAFEMNKQSLVAILIAFFIPLAVTLLFCGIKTYEDIKS